MSKYTIEEVNNKKNWDEFILKSINKNFYALSDCLSLEKNIRFFFIKKNNEKLALIPLKILGNKILNCDFLIQTPIIYRCIKNSNNYRNIQEQLVTVKVIKDFIENNFKYASITFDFRTQDMRPFLWSKEKKFLIQQKYTLIIDINKNDNNNFLLTNLFKNFSYTKRNQIRKSIKEKYIFEEKFSKSLFVEMMKNSALSHGQKFDEDKHVNLANMLEIMYIKKFITMFIVYHTGIPVMVSIISTINNFSTYLFSARSSNFQNNNLEGAFMMKNIFDYLKKFKIKQFDFEGMNSEKNSFYKMNYGGTLIPYYRIEFGHEF
jgi:hypothetical protein